MIYLPYCIRYSGYTKRSKLLGDIYNLAVILDDYCNNHSDSENISHILPLVKILLNKIDKLNVKEFI